MVRGHLDRHLDRQGSKFYQNHPDSQFTMWASNPDGARGFSSSLTSSPLKSLQHHRFQRKLQIGRRVLLSTHVLAGEATLHLLLCTHKNSIVLYLESLAHSRLDSIKVGIPHISRIGQLVQPGLVLLLRFVVLGMMEVPGTRWESLLLAGRSPISSPDSAFAM